MGMRGTNALAISNFIARPKFKLDNFARILQSTTMSSQAYHGPRRSVYRLTKDQRKLGLIKIKERIDELEMNTTAPKIVIIGGNDKDDEVGTDKAKKISITRYNCVWKAALDFCIEVADYDSAMLYARDICPVDPVPMSTSTAISCLRFHVQEKGTLLKHHQTNELIKSAITGEPLICQGDWRSTHSISAYCSALSKVHGHYETTMGLYCEECEDCRKVPLELARNGTGCRRHPGDPHYWRQGQPTTDSLFKTHRGMMINYVDNHYVSRKTFSFFPGQLRDLRLHLLATNNKYKLMIWTIILLGIKGFLRIDEALHMKVEDLPQDYFVVTQENVEGLCMKVKGKTDDKVQYLAIWDDAECPDFSASRALLIWLALSGITSGYLFPNCAQLQNGTTSPTETLPYDDFLQEIKALCTSVLKLDEGSLNMNKLILGTHMLRKTGYMLAYWGYNRKYGISDTLPMDKACILNSARHKDTRTVATYLGDSGTMKTLCSKIRADDIHQRVGEWQPIHIQTHDAFAALNAPSKQYIKSAVDLADWYVFGKLRVPRDGAFGGMAIYHIHHLACEFTPDLSSEEALRKLLQDNLPAGLLQQVLNLISKDRNAKIMAAVNHSTVLQQNALLSIAPVPTPTGASATNNPRGNIAGGPGVAAVAEVAAGAAAAENFSTETESLPENNLKRKYNPEDLVAWSLEYPQAVKKARLNKSLQVKLCKQCVGEVRAQVIQGKILQDPVKSFAYKAGRVVDCLEKCYDGSVQAFLEANKTFTVSRFNQCCNGNKHSASFGQSYV